MQRISGDLGGPCGEGPGSASLTLGDLEQGAREGAFRATALRISFSFVSLPFPSLSTVDTRERKGARWQVRPSSQNNSILIGRRRKARGWRRKLFTLYIKTRGEGTACSPSSCQFGPAVEEGVLGVGVLKGEI